MPARSEQEHDMSSFMRRYYLTARLVTLCTSLSAGRVHTSEGIARKHNLRYDASMRTTIDLPDELLRRTKAAAALQGLKLKDLIRMFVERGLNTSSLQRDSFGHR